MREYIAKKGERLDSIFYKIYDSFYQKDYIQGFDAFCLLNKHLLDIPVLNGGEIVYIKDFENKIQQDKELGI